MKVELFEEGQSTINEYQKSQAVRLYDVFLLAPFLMYIGYKAKGISNLERNAIYLIGIGGIGMSGLALLMSRMGFEVQG